MNYEKLFDVNVTSTSLKEWAPGQQGHRHHLLSCT